MEYYDVTNSEYNNIIYNSPIRIVKVKIEMLDHWEHGIGEIINDISSTDGSINVNNTQGCRRTCSISVIDEDKKYLPTTDSLFWYNRKFKIYIGLQAPTGNLYWFSQGVFYTQQYDIRQIELLVKVLFRIFHKFYMQQPHLVILHLLNFYYHIRYEYVFRHARIENFQKDNSHHRHVRYWK